MTCDFNPLHHEGGDLHFRHTFQPLGPISIHSTTRVETSVKDISDILTDISIHSTTRVETDIISGPSAALEFQSTPPRGWRLMRYQTSRVVEYFNPLHHEGGDSRRLQSPVRLSDFNPLHHEGGDPCGRQSSLRPWNFNPLHHEGGDLIALACAWMMINFNPLHHEGGDEAREALGYSEDWISIHSTTRVETFVRDAAQTARQISIHSTTRVETSRRRESLSNYIHFNPLHHEGGDIRCQAIQVLVFHFNPLHHEGGDLPHHR